MSNREEHKSPVVAQKDRGREAGFSATLLAKARAATVEMTVLGWVERDSKETSTSTRITAGTFDVVPAVLSS